MQSAAKAAPDIPTDIFERIKKLLALGERGGTEAEAANAMEMAYKLLAKYKLSMADMQESTAIFETSLKPMSRNSVWERILYNGIAELYFGQYLVSKRVNGTFHMVIARPENVALIHHVAQYLINTGKKLAIESTWRHPFDNKRAHMSAFCKGYAMRIAERAKEQIEEARSNGLAIEKCTALVISHYYDQEASAIDSYMQEQKIRATHARTKQVIRSSAGFHAGKSAGSLVNLNTNRPLPS